MQEDPAPAPAPGLIEVGETGATLRLWLAREAVRQGELRLAAQTANLGALEARATSLLAWSTAALLAGAAWGVRGAHLGLLVAPGLGLLATTLLCAAALRPRPWHGPGFTLSEMQARPAGSELEHLEWTAAGYESAAAENYLVAKRFSWLLRRAWLAFVAAAAAGVLGAAVSRLV